MAVVALYSIKGGVGKTAAAVNLAHDGARRGRRVLLWDMDPQAAATFYLQEPAHLKGGSKKLVGGKRPLKDHVRATDYAGLDLIPADFSLRNLDLVLEDEKKPTKQFRRRLKPLLDRYDLILLDCAPSISLVSENVFYAAEALMIPLVPTTLSVRTLDQLGAFKRDHKLSTLRLLPFFSLVDRRKRLHQDVQRQLRATRTDLLSTEIPASAQVERMGTEQAPLAHFARASTAPVKAYRALYEEMARALALP